MSSQSGFAYLFERFPSFTQTFCAREVTRWMQMGYDFPVYSLTSVEKEATRHFSASLYAKTQTLPDVDATAKRWWTPFSFRFRKIKKEVYRDWGVEGGRRRAAEAAWLGPRLLREGVRHVHVHFAGRAARTAYWLKKCYGISYSITAHANDFFVNAPGLFLDDLFQEAKFIVTVSDFSVAELRQRFPSAAEKIHRVYNGIDTDAFAPSPSLPSLDSLPQEPPSIVSVGRYIEKKGYPDLIQACSRFNDLDFSCFLIGEGTMEKSLCEQIARLGLAGKVHVTGPKSEGEVCDFLQKARVFALACRRESDGGMDNLPTVIMEAMAAGVPVVSTRLAGVPEMVDEEKTGLLVNEGDVEGLANALRRLLSNRNEASQMGTRGRAMAKERFDTAVTSLALQAVFAKYGVI